MGLFFKETVFLKKDSDLEKELSELENTASKTPDNNELNKYIKTLKAGIYGEKAIEYELENARIGLYVLHDINLQYEGNNAQIDYVIVSPSKCYIVECKNMIGDITIDNKGQFIRKLPWGKKESIYSPLAQAQRHVDVLKKIRDQNNGFIVKALLALSKDDYFRPLVVVSNSNGLLNMKYATKEIKNKVIRADQLVDYLQKDIDQIGLIQQNSKNEMERIANSILSLNVPKEKNNWLDKFQIKEESKNDDNSLLENDLLSYRRNESKKRNYPAYYVFNNKQLEALLNEKPSNIASLEKILEPVKVKIYGEDILKIIQKYLKK